MHAMSPLLTTSKSPSTGPKILVQVETLEKKCPDHVFLADQKDHLHVPKVDQHNLLQVPKADHGQVHQGPVSRCATSQVFCSSREPFPLHFHFYMSIVHHPLLRSSAGCRQPLLLRQRSEAPSDLVEEGRSNSTVEEVDTSFQAESRG